MSKPLRVAFSGAGFRIPAHIGALQAIVDAGFAPIQIYGTSAGSIVGALYACGMSLADMKALSLTYDWSGMMSFNPLSIFRMGLCSGSRLLDFINEHTGGKKFRDLAIDFAAVTSDLTNNARFTFSKANAADVPVALAVRASASIPFIYEPVRYQGMLLQDGGMVSNIAADSLTVDDVPRVGIQLVSNDLKLTPNGTLTFTGLAMRDIDLMLSACESAHVTAAQAAGAKMVFIDTSYASTLDRHMAVATRERLYDDGYRETATALQIALTGTS
ncbi:patatin-like phospholipase family protein [Burkholderia sp. JKS000303]|uniref:patatin-like phospholipase family protein n=1 Tax=Burkholderia sp. JKS000303 TaxID=1938747 RepID=UPI000BF47CA7|nr:patatin-like phospholipase family protein [Burkholderia sp. JKS000303]PFH29162.1 NTE family protein [Burkholderia sp. JKS000303]